MARRIVVVQDSGDIQLTEVAAHDERQLQERMMRNPNLLPLDELGLTEPVMVVGRETTLRSGAVDLVVLTRDGELLIIEFKTGPQNPDFRAALAQLLDYGSDLWRLTFEEFESTVAVRYFAGSHCDRDSPTFRCASLEAAARASWPDLEADGYARLRDRLTTALERGSLHYIVVAQRFTEPMEATAAYLNYIAPDASFYLVEMVRFTGPGLDAFEGRAVLRPAARPARTASSLATEAAFLDAIADDGHRDVAERFFEACRGLNLRFEWGSKGTSIRLKTPDKPEPVSIAWAFPPGVGGWMGLTDLTLGYDPTQASSAPSAIGALDRYVASIGHIVGTLPTNKGGLRAHTVPAQVLATSYTALVDAVAELVNGVTSDD